MGPRECQLLALLCVALSLTLFPLGGADVTSGLYLGTRSFASPSVIMGPILDTIVVSRDVASMLCEELAWHVNMYLLCL
jgi:hypothetical protein